MHVWSESLYALDQDYILFVCVNKFLKWLSCTNLMHVWSESLYALDLDCIMFMYVNKSFQGDFMHKAHVWSEFFVSIGLRSFSVNVCQQELQVSEIDLSISEFGHTLCCKKGLYRINPPIRRFV